MRTRQARQEGYTSKEAERMIQYAAKIFEFRKGLLSKNSRPELLKALREGLQSLADVLPVRRAILFGSWAKGKERAFSDIDLMVL